MISFIKTRAFKDNTGGIIDSANVSRHIPDKFLKDHRSFSATFQNGGYRFYKDIHTLAYG